MPKVQTSAAEIRRLAVYFRYELESDILDVYVKALEDIPLVALRDGAARAIRTRDFFPRVAELRRDVAAEAGETRTLTDLEARRIVHDQAVVGLKPWRLRCQDRGHQPPCETPNDCELLAQREES